MVVKKQNPKTLIELIALLPHAAPSPSNLTKHACATRCSISLDSHLTLLHLPRLCFLHLPHCQLSISDEAPTTTKLDSGDRRYESHSPHPFPALSFDSSSLHLSRFSPISISHACASSISHTVSSPSPTKHQRRRSSIPATEVNSDTPVQAHQVSWSSIMSSSMDVGLGDQLTKVASLVKSKEAYDLVIETAKRLSIQVEALNVPSTAGVNVEELANQQQVEEPINAGNVPQVMLLDPNLSQTKGRKRDGKGTIKETVLTIQMRKRKTLIHVLMLRMMKRTYRVELFFYMLFCKLYFSISCLQSPVCNLNPVGEVADWCVCLIFQRKRRPRSHGIVTPKYMKDYNLGIDCSSVIDFKMEAGFDLGPPRPMFSRTSDLTTDDLDQVKRSACA
ncbi:hypothetical protein Dimus_015550 [Dionaea muscipula]